MSEQFIDENYESNSKEIVKNILVKIVENILSVWWINSGGISKQITRGIPKESIVEILKKNYQRFPKKNCRKKPWTVSLNVFPEEFLEDFLGQFLRQFWHFSSGNSSEPHAFAFFKNPFRGFFLNTLCNYWRSSSLLIFSRTFLAFYSGFSRKKFTSEFIKKFSENN